ncbi:hypothetical protein HanIR_Chr10g0452741 [Helianthus annuus]|nr:hypothetical protein HanIR_Chr10g0452741 [Helianthus annuus]
METDNRYITDINCIEPKVKLKGTMSCKIHLYLSMNKLLNSAFRKLRKKAWAILMGRDRFKGPDFLFAVKENVRPFTINSNQNRSFIVASGAFRPSDSINHISHSTT